MILLGRKLCIIYALSLVFTVKLVKLIKICLCETYNTVRIVINLSDMFPIKTFLIKEMFYH